MKLQIMAAKNNTTTTGKNLIAFLSLDIMNIEVEEEVVTISSKTGT